MRPEDRRLQPLIHACCVICPLRRNGFAALCRDFFLFCFLLFSNEKVQQVALCRKGRRTAGATSRKFGQRNLPLQRTCRRRNNLSVSPRRSCAASFSGGVPVRGKGADRTVLPSSGAERNEFVRKHGFRRSRQCHAARCQFQTMAALSFGDPPTPRCASDPRTRLARVTLTIVSVTGLPFFCRTGMFCSPCRTFLLLCPCFPLC